MDNIESLPTESFAMSLVKVFAICAAATAGTVAPMIAGLWLLERRDARKAKELNAEK